jgi:hypothetical protein
MVPPGIPDFFTRARTLRAGDCELMGRAWSGTAPIATVEVSTDGGRSWQPADVDPPPPMVGEWQGWRCSWHAEPGVHELCCRATDAAGNSQPLLGEWNRGGYTNNAVQRVPVAVVET